VVVVVVEMFVVELWVHVSLQRMWNVRSLGRTAAVTTTDELLAPTIDDALRVKEVCIILKVSIKIKKAWGSTEVLQGFCVGTKKRKRKGRHLWRA
jgi:hypothetical protein